MGDSSISSGGVSPRKLPNPTTPSANAANSALKGILIKPKRILPPQPENAKVKKATQENGAAIPNAECKTDDEVNSVNAGNKTTEFGGNAINNKSDSGAGVNASVSTNKVVAVPKLQIDVNRLKNFFQLKGTAVTSKRKTDLNENDIKSPEEKDNEVKVEKLVSRSQSEGRPLPHPTLIRETTFYSSPSNVKEWCASRNGDKMTANMSGEQNSNLVARNTVRSPSPKSNTTWDRSSSGYSSDERADPRSPPPSHSASASVSSKTETEATNEDDGSVSLTADVTDDKTDVEDNADPNGDQDQDTLKFKEDDNSGSDNTNSNSSCNLVSNSIDDLLSSTNECSVVTLTPTPAAVTEKTDSTTGAQSCDNCDSLNNQGADKNDTTSSCVNFSFDTSPSVGVRQLPSSRRPVLTALSNSSGNGRIQYRKSGSESMINLRHPSRQGVNDSNFDGLEVCGKSFQQTNQNNVSSKSDNSSSAASQEGAKCDVTCRPDIASPTSAFSPLERPVIILDSGSDNNGSEGNNARIRGLKQIPVINSPRIRNNLNIGINTKLTMKDDKDIRRTLHDLTMNSPRRVSPGARIAPIRARHSIQVTSSTNSPPISAVDSNSNPPMPTQINTLPRTSVAFGKKMWRAQPGQPENAQMRPFSPFGGTLPPAKIKEQEQKRQHSDEFD